jgi:hypothetical protein
MQLFSISLPIDSLVFFLFTFFLSCFLVQHTSFLLALLLRSVYCDCYYYQYPFSSSFSAALPNTFMHYTALHFPYRGTEENGLTVRGRNTTPKLKSIWAIR